jgi:type VI secretion system protein ImpA
MRPGVKGKPVALPDGFDLDALLAPIRGDLPQGIDVREDFSAQSPYGRLRDARSNARDAEKQAESPDPNGPPAPDPAPLWRGLRDLGLKVLAEQTKDLEIAAWLAEAFVRSHGLGGLAACSRLIGGLAETYWDGVYPLPDEYGLETRVAPITGLNGQGGGGSLMAPLLKLVLYTRPDGQVLPLYQYQASAKLATLDAKVRAARIAGGAIAFEDIEKEARTIGRANLSRMRDAAGEALAAWEAMAAILDAKAGADSPSTSQVRDLLREITEIAARYASDGPSEEGSVDMAAQGNGAEPVAASGGGFSVGLAGVATQVASREEALRGLETIAAFFRRTEPQSALSYTLDEAVRRARLPWLDLLSEVLPDRTSFESMLTALGIRPPPPPE